MKVVVVVVYKSARLRVVRPKSVRKLTRVKFADTRDTVAMIMRQLERRASVVLAMQRDVAFSDVPTTCPAIVNSPTFQAR